MGATRLDSQMIPTRFLITMAHFIAMLMVFYSSVLANGNQQQRSSDYNQANSSILGALWMGILCFALEFVGLLMGVSMFMVSLNGFDIFAHFLGGILTCWYIVESWYYTSIWYLWVFFSFLPAAFEAVAFIRVFCCRVVAY